MSLSNSKSLNFSNSKVEYCDFQPNQGSIAKAGKLRSFGLAFAKLGGSRTYDSVPPYHAFGSRGVQPRGPSPNSCYYGSIAVNATAPYYDILFNPDFKPDEISKKCLSTPNGECENYKRNEDTDFYHPMYDKVQCKMSPSMDLCTPFTWYRYRR